MDSLVHHVPASHLQVQETDTRNLMDLYGEVAYADLEKESVYDLTEPNLLKVKRSKTAQRSRGLVWSCPVWICPVKGPSQRDAGLWGVVR